MYIRLDKSLFELTSCYILQDVDEDDNYLDTYSLILVDINDSYHVIKSSYDNLLNELDHITESISNEELVYTINQDNSSIN